MFVLRWNWRFTDVVTVSLTLKLDMAPRRVVGEVVVVDVCTPEESNVTYELGVLEELQTVFNPEMAHVSYVTFSCLIGRERLILCQIQNTLCCRMEAVSTVLK